MKKHSAGPTLLVITAQFRFPAVLDLRGGTSMTSRDVRRIVSVASGGAGFGCWVVPAVPLYVFANGMASVTEFKLGYMVTCNHTTTHRHVVLV